MIRTFFKDSAIYGLATVISGSITILLLPFMVRVLSTEEYGVIDLLLSAFSIVNVIVSVEISQALARFYPKISHEEQYIYASTGLWFTIVMYILFFVLSVFFIRPITKLLIGNDSYTTLCLIAFASMVTYGVFSFLQIQLRWMLKPAYYMITSILFAALSCIFTILFISYFKMNSYGFFIARIIGASIAGGVCWYYSQTNYKLILNIKILRNMLQFSSPLVISSLSIFICLYIDRFAIRAMLSLSDLGIYSASARIASIAGSMVTVINFALTPLIYSNYDLPKTPSQIAILFKIIVYAMLSITVFLLIFSKEILTLIVGETYSKGSLVLPLLVASFIISGLYNCAPGLWIAKKTKLIAAINITAAILNTILCVTFIPLVGFVGAAIATLISSIIMLGISTFYAQKYYFIAYDWVRISLAIAGTLLFSFLMIHR